MSEALKVIQICDHIISESYEEKKTIELIRQEERIDEKLECVDNRLIYFGDWEIQGEGDTQYMKGNSKTNRLDVVFYGDNVTLKGKKGPDMGEVFIYIDGEYVGSIDMYSTEVEDNIVVCELFDLDYSMHRLNMSMGYTSNADSTGFGFAVEGALIKDAFYRELLPFEYLTQGEVVTKIEYVCQVDGGKVDVFREGVDYVRFTSNKIKWLGLHRPHPNRPYHVDFFVRKYDTKIHPINTCPRCYGLGWYGSLQNAVTKQPTKVTGIYKIAEDIIKIILTPLQDSGYGSNFPEMNKALYMSSEAVEDYARSEIYRIETFYKSLQSEDMSKGAVYGAEDILYAVEINDVKFTPGDATLNLVITVYNNKGNGENVSINI